MGGHTGTFMAFLKSPFRFSISDSDLVLEYLSFIFRHISLSFTTPFYISTQHTLNSGKYRDILLLKPYDGTPEHNAAVKVHLEKPL